MINLENASTPELVVVVIALLEFAGFVGVLVWGILQAAKSPPPTLLIMTMSLLTLSALVGYSVTRLAEFGALAGAGFGAIAGAVATQFRYVSEEKENDNGQSSTGQIGNDSLSQDG